MKKLTLMFLFTTVLYGCSTLGVLDAVNPFKEDKGIEVNAQVGKNNTQVQTDNKALVSLASSDKLDVSTNSDNKANVINQATNTSSDKSRISTKSTSNTTNDNTADTINQETSSVTNYPTPVWLILAFAAMTGIAIPNPFNYFSDRRKRRERKQAEDQRLSEIEYLRGRLNEEIKQTNRQIDQLDQISLAKDS